MKYQIQNASEADLERIQQIYAQAREFMAQHGNETQWGTVYPERRLLERDIAQGKLYTVRDVSGIHGVFYFAVEEDPTYAVIHEGMWYCDEPYGVIHRIAGDGSGGILKAAVDYAAGKNTYLRIDTHENNVVMRKALQKLKFQRSGIIYIEDGTARIAYERMTAE